MLTFCNVLDSGYGIPRLRPIKARTVLLDQGLQCPLVSRPRRRYVLPYPHVRRIHSQVGSQSKRVHRQADRALDTQPGPSRPKTTSKEVQHARTKPSRPKPNSEPAPNTQSKPAQPKRTRKEDQHAKSRPKAPSNEVQRTKPKPKAPSNEVQRTKPKPKAPSNEVQRTKPKPKTHSNEVQPTKQKSTHPKAASKEVRRSKTKPAASQSSKPKGKRLQRREAEVYFSFFLIAQHTNIH